MPNISEATASIAYHCPHCGVVVKPDIKDIAIGRDNSGHWTARVRACPHCNQFSIHLIAVKHASLGPQGGPLMPPPPIVLDVRVWPRGSNRKPLPPEAAKYQDEYDEAARVLSDSAKASAALTRRLLQKILRDEAKTNADKLASQIDEVLKRAELPEETAQLIDVIRNIGNFAAHPDEIILDVTAQEAELSLDTLERVIDFYVVAPVKRQAAIDALNAKLRAAGKPELKKP